jgi:hypothetical protein
VNHAGLHDGLRPDRLDSLRQALEPVAHQHQYVLHAAVLEFGEHVQPVLGAFTTVAGPDAEDVAMTFGGDRQHDVDRPVRDVTIADLDVDGIDEQNRINPVQGSVLPLGHPVHHLV